MKVLVVIPPYVLGPRQPDNEIRAVLPHKAMLPVGPLMIAGQLRNRGHDVSVLDLVFKEEWWRDLPEQVPDMVLLSCHTLRNIYPCLIVKDKLLKLWGKAPYVVWGGNGCLELAADYFYSPEHPKADAVIRGFGHQSEVLSAIERKQRGDIWSNQVSELPLPATNLLSTDTLSRYQKFSGNRYPMYGFGTGCYWSCDYCSAKMDLPFQTRNPQAVTAEISLAQQLGYKEIWCVDNLTLINPETTLNFDAEVNRRQMIWRGMTRAEILCQIPHNFLHQLGALREIAIGVESANTKALRTLNRGLIEESRICQAFNLIGSAGITSNAFVILGLFVHHVEFLQEYEEDFWQLYDLLQKIKTSTVSWSFYNTPVMKTNPLDYGSDRGFYSWPWSSTDKISPERIVQQAMVISGTWWDKWNINRDDPYYETDSEFGVNFHEGRILQEKSARDAAGDIWCAWQKEGG